MTPRESRFSHGFADGQRHRPNFQVGHHTCMISISSYKSWDLIHLLWAPIIDDACQPYLLGIICNVRSNRENRMTEMSIRTSHNLWCCHYWPKGWINIGETRMIKLATKLLECDCFLLAFASLKGTDFSNWWKKTERDTVPFGIGRKAHGRNPMPCARCVGLSTLPGPIYNGWNSWWPVATDATVLSLPAMTLTSIAPWVDESWEISVYTLAILL